LDAITGITYQRLPLFTFKMVDGWIGWWYKNLYRVVQSSFRNFLAAYMSNSILPYLLYIQLENFGSPLVPFFTIVLSSSLCTSLNAITGITHPTLPLFTVKMVGGRMGWWYKNLYRVVQFSFRNFLVAYMSNSILHYLRYIQLENFGSPLVPFFTIVLSS